MPGFISLRPAFAVGMLALGGCSGIQSALDPAGSEAEAVALLFWVMVIGGALIWMAVIGTLVYAAWGKRTVHSDRAGGLLIFYGGAVIPSFLLAALLGYALWLMPAIRPWADPGDPERLRIEIVGEQFWWRVRYLPPGGPAVEAANEVRLPAGERVDFVLQSSDVIHSFWIPSLGGKMDMIPGRTTRLSLQGARPGAYRGACAEFCGTSHALMAFTAIVMEPADFRAWLAGRARPSATATSGGHAKFMEHGCAACHAIRGTEAAGTVGPDLSHVGSRRTLAAGILDNTEAAIARFIREPDVVKPGVRMPAFGMLPNDDIQAIAAYLKGLK